MVPLFKFNFSRIRHVTAEIFHIVIFLVTPISVCWNIRLFKSRDCLTLHFVFIWNLGHFALIFDIWYYQNLQKNSKQYKNTWNKDEWKTHNWCKWNKHTVWSQWSAVLCKSGLNIYILTQFNWFDSLKCKKGWLIHFY